MATDFRKMSKTEYSSEAHTTDNINIGSLQRIADATELMAKNYQSLLNDVKYYKERYNESLDTRKKLIRRISALRGAITRLKKGRK
jgi:hypothetical protein